MLSNIYNIPSASPSPGSSVFYPYPNENSFLLGDWYWNRGIQKSQGDFRKLLDIVGSPEFSSGDVRNTNWHSINRQLATGDWDKGEWEDEDAGWQRSSVVFQVPFDSNADHPGVHDYTVPDFYYRSLTAIIKEKLQNPVHGPLFHYEPYELFWQPLPDVPPVRLQGELYTSPAFMDAHREVQGAVGEPGCNLKRVVVALMFYSDATHLTSFGSAKLWPLYLFFGNESKYRRSKPSCNVCEHVAYFQEV
jgi:hypothetical protein